MAAASTYVKTNTHGVLSLADGTGTPVTLTVAYDLGDVQISGIGAKLNEIVHIERRGKYISSAHGNRIFPSVQFSAYVTNMVGSSSSAPGSLLEFLLGVGAYSANVSTLGTGRLMAVKMTLTIEGSNFNDAADETIVLNSVIIKPDSVQFKESATGNTISFTGDVMGSIVLTNSTNTVTLTEI